VHVRATEEASARRRDGELAKHASSPPKRESEEKKYTSSKIFAGKERPKKPVTVTRVKPKRGLYPVRGGEK
jgi:hypothetical protein